MLKIKPKNLRLASKVGSVRPEPIPLMVPRRPAGQNVLGRRERLLIVAHRLGTAYRGRMAELALEELARQLIDLIRPFLGALRGPAALAA